MAKKNAAGRRSLREYERKRDFAKTPEPPAATSRKRPKRTTLRFCVQKHLARHLHYDFRLEHGGVLLSWAVPKGPSLNPSDKRLAMRVEDHPLEYLNFEGIIPEGYGAGIVMLWDKGTWQLDGPVSHVGKALDVGEIKFTLDGYKLKGSWVLVRTGGRGGSESRAWLLIKHRDDWAGKLSVVDAAPLSVNDEADFADILARDNPRVWESHKPAEGGATGALLRRVIADAAKKLAERETRTRTASRRTARSARRR